MNKNKNKLIFIYEPVDVVERRSTIIKEYETTNDTELSTLIEEVIECLLACGFMRESIMNEFREISMFELIEFEKVKEEK